MDLIPAEQKKQIAEAAMMARSGLLEAQRHNKAVEEQNVQIIALLREILAKP